MPQINDLKVQALRQLGYLDKQLNVNECLYWKTFSNKTEYNDLKKAWLAAIGFNKSTLTDSYYAYLRSQGYNGSIPDMEWDALMASTLYFSPLTLFRSGEQGAWYDPSDMASLFQDSSGTIPVTAVEQTVGMMRDKSGRGNHMIQSTPSWRPTLSAKVNIVNNSNDFNNVTYWTKGAGLVLDNSEGLFSPDGGLAYKVTLSGTTGHDLSAILPFVLDTSKQYSASVWVRNETFSGPFQLAYYDGSTAVNGSTPAITTDWQRVSFTFTPGAATTPRLRLIGFGNGTDGQVLYLGGVQLDLGPTVLRYQAVASPTSYNTAGFPFFLRFDGVDDGMVSQASIDFSVTQKQTWVLGLRKTGTVFGVPAETSSNINTNAGAIGVGVEPLAGTYTVRHRDGAGIFSVNNTGGLYPSPHTAVLTMEASIGPVMSVGGRVNAVSFGANTSGAALAGYGNYVLNIGKRGDNTAPYAGNFYGAVIRGAASSASQISQTEAYMNAKTGAF